MARPAFRHCFGATIFRLRLYAVSAGDRCGLEDGMTAQCAALSDGSQVWRSPGYFAAIES